jgi:hypothetical protein
MKQTYPDFDKTTYETESFKSFPTATIALIKESKYFSNK